VKLHRTVVAGLAIAALAAPAAQAAPILDPGSGQTPQSSGVAIQEVAPEPVAADSPAVTTTIDEGLDWGSAAIGAGVAAALIALLVLGGFAFNSHGRRPVAH
jgi:hypothetical protein